MYLFCSLPCIFFVGLFPLEKFCYNYYFVVSDCGFLFEVFKFCEIETEIENIRINWCCSRRWILMAEGWILRDGGWTWSMVIASLIIAAEWAWYNSEMGIGRGASHWVRRDAPPAYPARAPDPTSKGSFICEMGIGRGASHWVRLRRDAPPECIGPYVARATDPTSKGLCVRAGEPIVSSSSRT